jgi:glycosyltransferase involved in cell wall biosynthesis
MEGILRVHDVEGCALERKLLRVPNFESEAGFFLPFLERLDVDAHDRMCALDQQPRDAAVATAAIEHKLVASEGEAELVETTQSIAKLPGAHRSSGWVKRPPTVGGAITGPSSKTRRLVTVRHAVGKVSLSVVLPVFNEAAYLPVTINRLLSALEGSGFEPELIVVDDGSTDGSAEVARRSADGRVPLRVLTQSNRGRFEARRSGLDAAVGEWVLLLDGRVQLDDGSLSYIHDRVSGGRDVWTAHVDVDADGNLYGVFWKLLAELTWSDYFDDPRDTSFGAEAFDRYPKGTTCFFAPRQLVVEAVAAFCSHYSDLRYANDDTPLIRWIAERRPINVSPTFRCTYQPRATLQAFLRHSFHRGVVFVDGHGRSESRFFPVVVAFYPASVLLAAAALRKPIVLPLSLLGTSAAAAGFGLFRRRNRLEVASLAALTPVYAVAHGLGMWRGLLSMATAS